MITVQNMSVKVGRTLKVSGKPTKDTRFSVNIGNDSANFALHLDVRFDYGHRTNCIALNCCRDGQWDMRKEEIKQYSSTDFPFQVDKEFKVVINFTKESFFIKLPNGTMISFPNHFGAEKYKYMCFKEDVKICSIKVK